MSEAVQDKDKDQDKEPKFVPVGPGADEDKGEKFAIEPDEKDRDQDRDEDADEDKDLDQEDARLASEPDEDKPRHGKESAKQRRQRQKVQRERERKELNLYRIRNEQLEKELMTRVQQVEGRQDQLSVAAIEQRVAKIDEQMSLADSVSFEALKAGTREDYAKAQSIRDQLAAEKGRLLHAKQTGVQQRQQVQQVEQRQQVQVDPEVQFRGRQWASDNSWFDPNKSDSETMIVRALDASVEADGFDPRTEDYWEELTRRCQEHLPRRFKAQDEDQDRDVQQKQRSSGPKFSSGGRERSLRKGEVYISAARKQAMKDAGMWEDNVLRQRMLKRYSEMDAELAASKA